MEEPRQMTAFDSQIRQLISILVCSDIEVVFTHLQHVFGLGPGSIERDPDGNPVHASLEAGGGVIWLHLESIDYGLKSPKTAGVATATMVVMVDDLDTHYATAVDRGADIVFPPVDQPYGYREYSARDPEGGFWSFMKPLDQDEGSA